MFMFRFATTAVSKLPRQAKTNDVVCLVTVLMVALMTASAPASIQLPQNMTKKNREQALTIIGLGTGSKILSDPYPLGGYAGFEAGFSIETFPSEELGRLGSGIKPPQQEASLPKLSIGKGLYNNLDIFLQFTPYSHQDELAEFGGIIRWGFYQASFLPLSLSLLAHASNANIANQLSTHTYGFDLVGGIDVENVALFAGLGPAEASGTFVGGSAGITDSKTLETEFVSGFHTVIGGNIHFSNYFAALQIDRYSTPVFSGKIGVRF